jgi:hypothetical protein
MEVISKVPVGVCDPDPIPTLPAEFIVNKGVEDEF